MSVEEDLLRDKLYDAILASRNSIRVIHIKKPVIEGGETYLVSFLLNLDGEKHAALCADAQKKQGGARRQLARGEGQADH
jgi:hypothetical protein